MDALVVAAGTALVGAMATDGWQQARTGLVALWRRVHPADADRVDAQLAVVRTQVLSAREAGDQDTERALQGSWQLQLQQLLSEEPALADNLQRLLDEELTPALEAHRRAHPEHVVINAESHDNSRQYFAGRDIHTN